MFNDDQKGYMRSLASKPLEAKCGCGWDMLGECYTCRKTAARVRGVTSRQVSSWPGVEDTVYQLPSGESATWADLIEWLKRVAPTCFAEPVPPEGWVSNSPWVRLPDGCRCPTCRGSLLARALCPGPAPTSEPVRERLVNWCRTCGAVTVGDEAAHAPAPVTPAADPGAP